MAYRTGMLKTEYWIKLSDPLFLLHSSPFVFRTQGGKRTKPQNLAQASGTGALHRGVTAETGIGICTSVRERFSPERSSVALNLAIAEGAEIAEIAPFVPSFGWARCPRNSEEWHSQRQFWSLVFYEFIYPFCYIWGYRLGVVTGQMELQWNKEQRGLDSPPACTTTKSVPLRCT